MKRTLVVSLAAICVAATAADAQQAPAAAPQSPPPREDALDPSPVDPAVDPNISMFINDWRNAKPRPMYGTLVFRDMLTPREAGVDPMRPRTKGAILSTITAVSYATLAPGASASGRAKAGERQTYYTVSGTGTITSGGKAHDLKRDIGFLLTPDFDFKIVNTGKTPLAFYVRTEPVPAGTAATPALVVVNRLENDRRIGGHWLHICTGGPPGMNVCTMAPNTMPQPHSHPFDEAWIMLKGESILSMGKEVFRMTPGQAYTTPPSGMQAHTNANLTDEPIELIYMGPAIRGPGPGGAPSTFVKDFARLDNTAFNPAKDPDVDMFMGNWRDAFPRIMHGNLYMRDMLTALQGPDSLHPTRKGAVLTNAEAVSHAQLEGGATAHRLDGELKGLQETFVVNSGTGTITSGSTTVQLAKGKSFIITPGLDFKLTATPGQFMTFYVVTEKLPAGFTPKAVLQVVDNRAKPQTTANWVDRQRALITKGDGMSQYGAVTEVELKPMAMSRPYSAGKDVEEIWIATEGDIDMLFGKMMRKLPAGTAYRIPSTGITAQARLNVTNKTAKFLTVVK